MRSVVTSAVCERVRAQISLELDGELSELEGRMLASHLERCPECRAFEADLIAFTNELRSAEPESLEHPIVFRRQRRVSFARVQVGVAAAVAVIALGAGAQVMESEPAQESFRSPVRFATSNQLTREVQQIVADGRAFEHRQGNELPI
jgi:predicted anti-sigma-YlaC factor YlaD